MLSDEQRTMQRRIEVCKQSVKTFHPKENRVISVGV